MKNCAHVLGDELYPSTYTHIAFCRRRSSAALRKGGYIEMNKGKLVAINVCLQSINQDAGMTNGLFPLIRSPGH